ncbi:Fumarylacetoacetate hydrolase [Mycena chlorophos]|uniref:Fumarylacetoacetate hydrolase n=1 Tax=Mycena chlorophos TaxID=658473 RepID=A0A8H6WJF9_MYCCL|nr:Fumarylacetoacetate hydrolase [Mycena chlorophos]
MRATAVLALLGLSIGATAERFVRFISTDGKEYTGDAILHNGDTDASHSKKAYVITGDILGEYKVTSEVKAIEKLLAPLDPLKTRSVRCVGFNYAAHDVSENITIPQYPILFFKPWTALAPPNGIVPVTAGYQVRGPHLPRFWNAAEGLLEPNHQRDALPYRTHAESELVVVIKSKAYNISVDQALDHVLGYASGYDVSHRGWQIARGGEPQPQFSMGKDADGWGPWGPAIVTKDIIPDPQKLNIYAKVNGVTKQNDTTANMLFGVAELVSFFSMGITLWPGDIIFTGTPNGTQETSPNPVWLQDGDVVEVSTEGLGTVTNTITYV